MNKNLINFALFAGIKEFKSANAYYQDILETKRFSGVVGIAITKGVIRLLESPLNLPVSILAKIVLGQLCAKDLNALENNKYWQKYRDLYNEHVDLKYRVVAKLIGE